MRLSSFISSNLDAILAADAEARMTATRFCRLRAA
jgi:hypothetical protein